MANVALPSIGRAFDASQTSLNLIAVGFSWAWRLRCYTWALSGTATAWLLLLLGIGLSIPAALLASFAWTEAVLIIARIFGGVAAGMAYPTTLALIAALWADGPARTAAIAKWSAIGSGVMVLGPLAAGWLLEHYWWGSVFLITVPLAVVAFLLALRLIPAHVNETTEPVDNAGGVLSILMIAGLVLAINFAPMPDGHTEALLFAVLTVVATVLFIGGSGGPATRCTTWTSPSGGSSGSRRWPASSCSARSWEPCTSVSSSCRTSWDTTPWPRVRR